MSRRLSRISLALVFFVSTQVWALGLGEIRLDSALNEPLRAEIQLLSATPEELAGLRVSLASAETFQRYGLDRPTFLQNIEFRIRPSGRTDGNIVEVSSESPITEPFITFLVEASWARGRLLREYTVLLDPPTFSPPAQSTPAVTAPTRSDPADSGRIERQAPAPEKTPDRTSPPRTAEPPVQAPQRSPIPEPDSAEPMAEEPTAETDFEPQQPAAQESAPSGTDRRDTIDPRTEETLPPSVEDGGNYVVVPDETLWGISSRIRPTARVSMNQTMLAIFEANPEAFGGNINILRAGASLRIPSESEIIRIGREAAVAEVQRQHEAWQPGSTFAAEPEPEADEPQPVAEQPVEDTAQQPDLTLVPPDEEDLGETGFDDGTGEETAGEREQDIERRIAELEAADVPIQQSLIEIRDNELAALREELAQIRGEDYEPGDEDPFVADTAADEAAAGADDAAAEPEPTTRPARRSEPSLGDQVLGVLSSWWLWILIVVVIVGGLLFWFMRRSSDDEDAQPWSSIDRDDLSAREHDSTETMVTPIADESIMVVEQDSAISDVDQTVDAAAPDFGTEPAPFAETPPPAETEEQTVEFNSLQDTFSSETAINLDQSDPIAEADFHMAYGLYDQAADLINSALASEPEREDLLSKLCEIYFVWGNREAFIDAARRLKAATGGAGNAEWNKIVIMGQQIAADDDLFAGAEVSGGAQPVDLHLDTESEGTAALDMEFGDDSVDGDSSPEMIDFGDADESAAENDDEGGGLDFAFDDVGDDADDDTDDEATTGYAGAEDNAEVTAEMPAPDPTVESPTLEQPFDVSGDTELPSIDADDGDRTAQSAPEGGQASDATAEIELDDLGLDLDGLDETEVASIDDDDPDSTGELQALSASGEAEPPLDDPDATGSHEVAKNDETGINEAVSDPSLLEATGATQVLPDDYEAESASPGDAGEAVLSDDDATLLAPGYRDSDSNTDVASDVEKASGDRDDDDAALDDNQETLLASLDDDDDDDDFDYVKTEALPRDAFAGNTSMDDTGELPAVAATDVDLDLDDLTAALQVNEMGDTVEQERDDATVQQLRPDMDDAGEDEDDEDDYSLTTALDSDSVDDDLEDARTMTEVGTKLDLARAYVDMGDPSGARSILEEVLDEGDEGQRQQAQQLLDTLPS